MAATVADSDYASKTGTVTFNPAETSKTVTVDVAGSPLTVDKRGLESLLEGTVGVSGPADAFRRGLVLAWRGAL